MQSKTVIDECLPLQASTDAPFSHTDRDTTHVHANTMLRTYKANVAGADLYAFTVHCTSGPLSVFQRYVSP